LRYAIEVFKDLFDGDEVLEFVKLLKPLQDDLGYANDVRVANELLADLRPSDAAVARAAGIVLGWHERGLADHQKCAQVPGGTAVLVTSWCKAMGGRSSPKCARYLHDSGLAE